MKRFRFTDQRIAYVLKQAELGTPIPEVCRKMGISDAAFYSCRMKFARVAEHYLSSLFSGTARESLRAHEDGAKNKNPAHETAHKASEGA